MTAVLSPEWFDAAGPVLAGLAPAGDVSAVVQYAVSSAPDGKVTFHAVIDGGVVSAFATGKGTDPDVVISCNYDAFVDVLDGTKSADAAFMDASFKVEGDHKVWLIDLRDVRSSAFTALAAID
ncbi:MAG: SCP2 sterol-binding domain-containing protein [Actinomycetota bacterium]